MAQPAPLPPAALARLLGRRVPPEKRQRTAMSCDFCKRKRCKCSRPSSGEPCRACTENGEVCRITEPRKQRVYYGVFPAPGDSTATSMPGADATGVQQTSNRHATPRDSRKAPSRDESNVGEKGSGVSTVSSTRLAVRDTAAEAVFEDLLGLPQYIGPTGSYTLLVALREMLSIRYSSGTSPPEAAQTMGLSMQYGNGYSLIQGFDLPPRNISDTLVETFFTKVHRDFPVFHRAVFQASYEGMWSPLPETDPAWLMTLYMVFALALETAPDNGSTQRRLAAQARYLTKAKSLLPEVITGCTLGHVQALMLYCLLLHISRERTSCWNITGVAIRMAIAIGLHRNAANPKCSPLERELRKRVWWTLYAFERLECSSLGRASAIEDSECNAPVPTEGFLDMGDIFPIGHLDAQSELLKLIGIICKNQYSLHTLSAEHLDFAQGISQQLDAWHSELPSHLRRGAEFPKLHFRSITLLHLQYQYAITLLARPFLAYKTRRHAPQMEAEASLTTTVDSLAQKCTDAAIVGVDLLQDLFSSSCFNSKTSWDVYFMESFAMILAIGKFAHESDTELHYLDKIVAALESGMGILKNCDGFSATMERFAHVTADFSRVVVVAAKSKDKSPPQPNEYDGVDPSPTRYTRDDSEASYDDSFHVREDTSQDYQFLNTSWVEPFPGDELGHYVADLNNGMSWEDFGHWVLQ
ncbi:Fungal-specific transcription factor [Pleurostoma richardsiae]|uniref:Fungal-specific transcription factor n=1 Tax=Pleurostoma richardsiae TaxID=41990 RepID=A0AA38REN8_9PEZI|nr:Fungal-specific transcription factor [Pleurostoma richardsiae]